MIISRLGDLVKNIQESNDLRVDVIYVTQQFIQLPTLQSNYGMCDQIFLFQNPIMKLTPKQLEVCRLNFEGREGCGYGQGAAEREDKRRNRGLGGNLTGNDKERSAHCHFFISKALEFGKNE